MSDIFELKEEAELALRLVEGLSGRERIDALIRWNSAKKEYEEACRAKRNNSVHRSYRLGKR